jgi:formate-dependent phosphoribosylglycinamide formyltransferase (GAR transformylase)
VDNFAHDVCVDTMPSDYFWRRQKAATSYMDTNSTNLRIGTPHTSSAVKVMMLGSGELGKEVVIELQRYGVEVIAVDRYANAPAMQVAHRSYSISMLDALALRSVIEKEKPDYIVPEVEAIATQTLVELEKEGFTVIPTATAARLTMNREGIRTLAKHLHTGLPQQSTSSMRQLAKWDFPVW